MIFHQADSTAVNQTEDVTAVPVKEEIQESEPKHPYQVLQSLPADATPAQQDSAIQAVFHVENTHLSTRPDTLHLPGQDIGENVNEVNLPQYYRENFFSKDSLLHPELDGGRYGIAGDPVPYTIRGDDTITALLLGCFILAMIAFSKSKRFIFRQAKNFFYEPSSLTTEIAETTNEIRFQSFLVLQTCLLFSIVSFLYTLECVADTFILSSQYQLIAIFFGVLVAYFLFRYFLYGLVNTVFFGKRKSVRWLKHLLFITSVEGILIFPLVLLQSYFDLSIQNAVIYVAVVIILVKILLFYKSYVVFFRQKGMFLQIFLYFCALEIMPLLSLLGILEMIVDYLKIKF
ncbi:MAG: DUF4271 domain-containing protein [Prevotellaceae bacterium]|nr:DUF4271 domain-containing protein [Prevotellaceae bacterium]